MSNRHFLLYDFLLPLLGLSALGWFLSGLFDVALFRWLDHLQAFGIGDWFTKSPLRRTLWEHSWVAFAVPPALLWLVWIRMNLERDWVNKARRLDRPLFKFFRGLLTWVEGGSRDGLQLASLRHQLAYAENKVRTLQAEVNKMRRANSELEAENQDLHDELSGEPEAELGFDMPDQVEQYVEEAAKTTLLPQPGPAFPKAYPNAMAKLLS